MTEAEYVAFIKEETDLDREAELYSLEHHGVKGQKWGIRRTPAQLGHKESSGRNKKSGGIISKIKKSVKKKKTEKVKVEKAKAKKKEESKEEIKKKVLSSSDPKYIYQHMDLLDSRELQDRIDRIAKETRMKELANPKKQDPYKKAEEFLKTTASMAESVTKIYNAYNVVTGNKDSGKKKQNKDQQNKDQQNKDQQNKDQQNKDQQSLDNKEKDKSERKGILGIHWRTRTSTKDVNRAVDDIMNDPAVQALMHAPVLTQQDRDKILQRAQQEREKRKKNHFGFSN